MTYWLNGDFKDAPEVIHIADRGFLLGDGIFETILLVNGVPAFWDAHMLRLDKALKALHYAISPDVAALSVVRELAVRNNVFSGSAVLRITVSRGAGGRGLAPAHDVTPSVLMTVQPYAPPAATALKLTVSDYRRSEASVSSKFKTLNYLDNIMARDEASNKGCDEAIMLNSVGRVACASAANVFVLADSKRIVTPPLSDGALPGVVRSVLLDAADVAGFDICEQALELPALAPRAIFLTNSLIGLHPAYLGADEHGALPDGLLAWYKTALEIDLKERARLF